MGDPADAASPDATQGEGDVTAPPDAVDGPCPGSGGDNPHGIEPDSPEDPDIVAACEALCEARAAMEACPPDPATCVDDCARRACFVCPGTLADLLRCEAENFDPVNCACTEGSIDCPTSPACVEENAATYQCGG